MTRLPVLFVVIGVLIAGVLYDRVDEQRPEVVAVETEAIVTPSVSDPSRLDGAWFCPVGSSSPNGFADQRVHVSNLADEAAVANVAVLTGEGRGPNIRVDIPPLSTQSVDLSSFSQADVAGAVVEIIGGTGVVGHTVQTEVGAAEGACSTHVSNTWFFAGGRTTRDSTQYLALMNPFPEDVVFNVEFYRAAGRPRRPAELQGGVIPASSVRIIDVGEFVAREENVATAISTVRGRLVAERLQIMDGVLGPEGAALQLGVVDAAPSWMLASGRVHAGGDDRVVIFNPSLENTASVDVQLWPTNPTDRSLYGLAPIPRELLPGRFEVVDLRAEADRFRLFLPYEIGVSVTSTNNVPVVAERWHLATEIDTNLIGAGGDQVESTLDIDESSADATADDTGEVPADEELSPEELAAEDVAPGELDVPGILGGQASELPQPTASSGIATTRGTEVLSDRWILPWVPLPSETSSVVVVSSPNDATAEIFVLSNGELAGPFREAVPAGGRAVSVINVPAAAGPILVVADQPVSVEAQVVAPDGSLSVIPGIPTVD
ncbi:MAG: DUF5719 family protein [Actinomycetota bacterium]